MDATGAIIFFGLVVALVLFGVGGYFVSQTDAFREWWEDFKERRAVRAEQRQAQRAALAEQRAVEDAALQREREWGIETPFPAAVVLDWAVERMTRDGWALQSRSDTTASFARDQGANACLGCILMLFFLLPGILYLLLANRTARITLAAYPHAGGSRLVIGGDHPPTTSQLASWARDLRYEDAPPLAELSSPEESAPPTQTASGASTLAEKLRESGELRDAGLITEEEFEAKKKELLDRM